MSQPLLLKVYGNLYPCAEEDRAALARAAAGAVPAGPDGPVTLEGDLLRISFEGLWFPVDEVLAAVAPLLTPERRGKLDVLDLEAWRMARHLFAEGRITSREVPLNNVLDFSGH